MPKPGRIFSNGLKYISKYLDIYIWDPHVQSRTAATLEWRHGTQLNGILVKGAGARPPC